MFWHPANGGHDFQFTAVLRFGLYDSQHIGQELLTLKLVVIRWRALSR
jgi:hypothetical protein